MIQLLATGATSVLGGLGSGIGNALSSLESKWFGGGATDAARQARTDWFHTAAKEGSVYAARIMLGAQQNVSGNEWNKEWNPAVQQLQSERPDVVAAAVSQGPFWDTHDNATSDNMRRLVLNELQQLGQASPGALPSTQHGNPELAGAVQQAGSAIVNSAAQAINPSGSYLTIPTNTGTLLLIGAAVVVGALVLHHHGD